MRVIEEMNNRELLSLSMKIPWLNGIYSQKVGTEKKSAHTFKNLLRDVAADDWGMIAQNITKLEKPRSVSKYVKWRTNLIQKFMGRSKVIGQSTKLMESQIEPESDQIKTKQKQVLKSKLKLNLEFKLVTSSLIFPIVALKNQKYGP